MPTTSPKPIEVFSPGSWTAMSGESIAFSEADLRKAAEVYDPAKSEAPLVVGHPKVSDPAYGWCERFEYRDGKLFAIPHQVDPAFAELVNAGRYKRVSIRWFRPDAAENPVPGSWYPEHVGFLGAHPPAVTGLKPASFAGDAAGLVEFAVGGMTLAGIMRRLRDWLLADRGMEVADQVLPDYLVSNLEMEAVRELDAAPSPAYAAPRPVVTEEPMTTPTTTPPPAPGPSPEDLAQRERELNARKAELDRAEFGTFVDKLIGEGKALPVHKDFLVQFMASLPASSTVEFSRGDARVAEPSLAAFKAYLSGQPKLVELGEFGRVPVEQEEATSAPAFAAPAGFSVEPSDQELYGKAKAYQQKHPGTDITTAYKAVGGK